MALFTKASTGSPADKFEGVVDGLYVGELVGFEEGRPYVDPHTGEESPKVRWLWNLYSLDGKPVVDPATGKQRVVHEQTSTKTGDRAKAPRWFEAHLNRTWSNREDLEATQDECVGKRVMLNISTKPGDGGWRKIDVFPSQ